MSLKQPLAKNKIVLREIDILPIAKGSIVPIALGILVSNKTSLPLQVLQFLPQELMPQLYEYL